MSSVTELTQLIGARWFIYERADRTTTSRVRSVIIIIIAEQNRTSGASVKSRITQDLAKQKNVVKQKLMHVSSEILFDSGEYMLTAGTPHVRRQTF